MSTMPINNGEYWENRSEAVMKSSMSASDKFLESLHKQYRSAINDIEEDIAQWYVRYSKKDNVTYNEAKLILSYKDLEELKWDIEQYIKFGKENAINGKWVKQLERASTRAHISRLDSILLQIRQKVEELANAENVGLSALGKTIYKDSYYTTAYNFAVGTGVGMSLSRIDNNKLEKVLSSPWSSDGKVFSERIWEDRDKLIGTLEDEFSQNIIRGLSPRDSIKRISEKFNVSFNNAKRLVNTESTYFCSLATEDTYSDLDVEKFQILAALDNRTSEICQDMDGKTFLVSQFKPGITAPPFHPNCRSTTIPYFDNNYGKRVARDNRGKVEYVPSDMTYNDWKKKYVK